MISLKDFPSYRAFEAAEDSSVPFALWLLALNVVAGSFGEGLLETDLLTSV